MFIHPALLWGFALISIPLVIHLINLLRHRRVQWAAMEFLLAAYRKHRTRVRMKELLLLLMRMAAVAIVVLLVAQPILKSKLGALLGGVKVHHIVILDDSYSMSERVQESGTFDNAKRVLTQLADETTRQTFAQQFTLLRTSKSAAGHLKPDFHNIRMDVDFPTQLHGVLENTQPSESAIPVLDALNAIEELAPAAQDEKRIVYVLSDFRRKDWEENTELVEVLKKLDSAGVTLRLVDCAQAETPNLTISDLRAVEGTRAVNVPLMMKVRVTNYSGSAVKNVVVHPQVESSFGSSTGSDSTGKGAEGTSSGTQMLPALNITEIPPHESVEETFPVRFPTAGSHRVTASLDADAILTDNVARCAEEIPPFESVLVIDESADATTSRPLITALAPGGNVNTGLVTRIEAPRFLSTNSLDEFKTIYLLNVSTLDASAITALETFLKNGGGVACFLGDRTDPVLAQKWYRNGEGFFPVLLNGPTDLPIDLLQKVPDMRVSEHPIFRVFSGSAVALLSTVNISRYYSLDDASLSDLVPLETAEAEAKARSRAEGTPARNRAAVTDAGTSNANADSKAADGTEKEKATDAATKPAGGDTLILAQLRNNDPLVLERQYGRGRVVVFLTSADASWNNWSQGNPSYVVAMLQLQAYLSYAQEESSQWYTDAPLVLTLDGSRYLPEVRFFDADVNLLETLQAVLDSRGVLNAVTKPMTKSGFYTAEYTTSEQQPQRRVFAVQVDPKEGDTARIDQEALANLLKDVQYELSSFSVFHYGDESLEGTQLTDFLLYFLVVWLFLEMLLATSASYHLKREQ